MLKTMLVGSAFVVPMVASFSMDGRLTTLPPKIHRGITLKRVSALNCRTTQILPSPCMHHHRSA